MHGGLCLELAAPTILGSGGVGEKSGEGGKSGGRGGQSCLQAIASFLVLFGPASWVSSLSHLLLSKPV